nr:MAG TPA: hypothetical protein [Caudoviricetes sp.]
MAEKSSIIFKILQNILFARNIFKHFSTLRL